VNRADIAAHAVVSVLYLVAVVALAALDHLDAPIVVGLGYGAVALLTVADQRNYRR
jgi:hypothetical protein